MPPSKNEHDRDDRPAAPPPWGRREIYRSVQSIGLSSIGGALVFYDFIIFVFLAPVIGKLFFPATTSDWLPAVQSFGIFAVGYLFRPLGGVVLGHFGDLFGRRRLFAFSILLMSIATLGISALPTYQTIGIAAPLLLIALRCLQGIAIGGEVPGAWAFICEHIPRRHAGLACGLICTGLAFGILLASGVTGILNALFTSAEIEAFVWRIPFLIGGLFGLPALYARWCLKETPVFSRMIESRTLVPELPLKAVLRDHSASVVFSILLTWAMSAGVVVAALMTASLLQMAYGYSAEDAMFATIVGTSFIILGSVLAGVMVDKIGAGNYLMGGSLFFAMATFAFYAMAGISYGAMFVLYSVMGVAIGLMAAVPYVMVMVFPARVRVTGISFSYNISYAVFGGLAPIVLAYLIHLTPMVVAYYLLFASVLGFGLGAYLAVHPRMLDPDFGDFDVRRQEDETGYPASATSFRPQ
ncbi:MFS transporter [Pseudomonas sp. R2.Fl]|nr:MFS transporter [Pseudomonas sp. R2.Fl]